MTTVREYFIRMMKCTNTHQLAEILTEPLPIPAWVIHQMSDEELENTYKDSLANKDYFGAFSAAKMVLINALRREDRISIYAHVAAMLFTSILDGSETAFVCLSLVWPIIAFFEKRTVQANLVALAMTGSWIKSATDRKQQEGGTTQDGKTAMFLFQSMSIFHILAIKKTLSHVPVGDPMEVATLMEQFGLKGTVNWVRENS